MVDEIREKVLNFIRKNGPVLPIQISKHLETNLIFASAILSELVSRKQLKSTNANIGSSPVYYIPGQDYLLGPRLYNYLKEKEKEGYDTLRDKKLIRDTEAEPWQRIVFRNLKDFALPIHVTIQDKTEIFWKFYLISEEEAKNLITNIIESKEQDKIEKQVKKIKKQEDQLTLDKKQEIKKSKERTKERIKHPKKDVSGFYNKIISYLNENKITVLEEEVIRKNREINFLVELPSALGALKYFLKAKNKKSINDAEIILSHSQSQEKRLPCLFITNGKLTKKAQKLIEKKLSGQFFIKQI